MIPRRLGHLMYLVAAAALLSTFLLPWDTAEYIWIATVVYSGFGLLACWLLRRKAIPAWLAFLLGATWGPLVIFLVPSPDKPCPRRIGCRLVEVQDPDGEPDTPIELRHDQSSGDVERGREGNPIRP
jgi:hypothetical protein